MQENYLDVATATEQVAVLQLRTYTVAYGRETDTAEPEHNW